MVLQMAALGWVDHKSIASAAVESLLERYPKSTVMCASVFGDGQPETAVDRVLVVAGCTADHSLLFSHQQYEVRRTRGGAS